MKRRGPGVLDCLKKRRLLNDPQANPALCRKYGEEFLALGWWEDALEFFRKADYQPGLEKLLAHCLEEGDAYLLSRLGPQAPAVWRQVAERARSLGKFRFALQAAQQAGDEDGAAELKALVEQQAPSP